MKISSCIYDPFRKHSHYKNKNLETPKMGIRGFFSTDKFTRYQM